MARVIAPEGFTVRQMTLTVTVYVPQDGVMDPDDAADDVFGALRDTLWNDPEGNLDHLRGVDFTIEREDR